MTDNRRRVDQIQDPGFLTGIDALPIDELRSRRALCDDLDVELSYYRRMLHGRMDLLAFEMRRRAGEEEQTLLEALPRILSEGAYISTSGLPERAVSVHVPDIPSPGRRLVDHALEGSFLARLPSMSDDDLRETQAFLAEVETSVSQERRIAHTALDRLQEELTRRYRDDGADPGELLAGG
ncbi:MAG: hypothetical protein Q8Q29_11125 [Actinomycetota bacterium]|jgi:hypothetical protein|nr:hypothetical protein [Actinomycetota bacterium]